MDEIDEAPLLAPPPRQRFRCARSGCRNLRRPGNGRLCNDCHAAAMRRWRGRASAPTPQRPCTASTAADAVRRRVALHRAIARGELARGTCLSGSGHGPAIAHFTAPATEANPFAGLAWICRRCRHEFVEGERITAATAAAERKALEERRLYAARLEATLAAASTIPADDLERLKELAARGPAGINLERGGPWFRQRLAALVEQYLQ